MNDDNQTSTPMDDSSPHSPTPAELKDEKKGEKEKDAYDAVTDHIDHITEAVTNHLAKAEKSPLGRTIKIVDTIKTIVFWIVFIIVIIWIIRIMM